MMATRVPLRVISTRSPISTRAITSAVRWFNSRMATLRIFRLYYGYVRQQRWRFEIGKFESHYLHRRVSFEPPTSSGVQEDPVVFESLGSFGSSGSVSCTRWRTSPPRWPPPKVGIRSRPTRPPRSSERSSPSSTEPPHVRTRKGAGSRSGGLAAGMVAQDLPQR